MTIVIVFKNGYELKVKCESVTTTRNLTDILTKIEFNGVKENQVMDLNLNEVICIYRVVSDEEEGE